MCPRFSASFSFASTCFWLIRSIIDVIDDRKRDKRNAQWEAERQQLEKERAQREVEYHESRMKELDKQ